MRARRTDQNLSEIIGAARAAGFRVYVNNNELCDLVWQLGGRTELIEVKNAAKSPSRRRFTAVQQEMRAQGWKIRTIQTIEDVLTVRKELLK